MVKRISKVHDEVAEGKYRILEELGEGGTAVVYLAVARGPSGFNKLVVLKALKRNLCDKGDFRKMFLQEARLAARLHHPFIVQTYEVVDDEGLPLIVMEYLEGQPLSEVLSRANGTLPLAIHLRILTEAVSGLHYAHEATDFNGSPLGLVHRDMTPHNLFVTFDGQTKLLDFGIAKLTTSNPETQFGVIKGKLRYMPPEQIGGEPVDRRADIYAMGVMLWEAAAGREMWSGISDATLMNRVVNGDIPSPRSVRPDASPRLEEICMKALAYEREDRYATAAELEVDLEQMLDSLGPRASSRATGKFVSDLFADVREQTKALIEAGLSKVASLSDQEIEPPLPDDRPPSVDGVSSSGRSLKTEEHVVSRKRGVALGFGAATVLGIVFAAVVRSPARRMDSMAPAASAAAAASSTPGVVPAYLAVRVSAVPPEAKLFFDGELLPNNPFERLVPSDGSQHMVRAEAPDYETASTAVLADKDTEVKLTLTRSRHSPDKPRPRLGPATHAAGEAKSTSAKVDCNPPYRVEADGTKKFKLECL